MYKSKAEQLAWESFTKTGKIGYFMLYRALQGVEDATAKGQRNSDKENEI